jgi:hypothetical protein
LEVTTGWVNSEGGEEAAGEPFTLSVPLPPDFEAFDGLISSADTKGDVLRKPKILKSFRQRNVSAFGPEELRQSALSGVEVTECEYAEILIPGFRLWRSTSVTLGAQRADQISVLPDMNGIVALFKPVRRPRMRPIEEGGDWWVELRVWTSEGSDASDTPILVKRSPQGPNCQVAAAN